jgi:uncharacterized membrane protein YqjE
MHQGSYDELQAGDPPWMEGAEEAWSGDGSARSSLRSSWADLRAMAREHLYLAVLEAQRAGMHLTYILAAVLVVSVLIVTAWLALVTGLVVWLTTHISWPWILLLAAVVNLLGAAFVAWWAKRKFMHVPFSATLRQLAAGRREIRTRPTDAQP